MGYDSNILRADERKQLYLCKYKAINVGYAVKI